MAWAREVIVFHVLGVAVVLGQWRGMNEKCAITLHSCISVTDQVKINEQNKSIGTGPLCV